MRDIFLLGFGAPLVDILVNVSDDFVREHVGDKGGMDHWSIEQQQKSLSLAGTGCRIVNGGSAGNTVNCLANLGAPCAMLGMTGNDELGLKYASELEVSGGSAQYIFKHETEPTGRCISFITPDSERTMRSNLGASSFVFKEDIDKVDFSRIDIVYFEGYRLFEMESFEYALAKARDAGCRTAIDFASFNVVELFRDKLHKLYQDGMFDMIFANEEEAKAFFGNNEHEKNIVSAMKYCDIAVIKLGKSGSLIGRDGMIYKIPVSPGKAVDTTGAGDSWAGGFFYGLYRNFDMNRCGAAASDVSAEIVQVEGAKLPADTWKKLVAKYK